MTEHAGWGVQIKTGGGWLLHSTYTDEAAAKMRAARLNESFVATEYRTVRLLAEVSP